MTITEVGDILIERAKIVEYLLDASHPDNGGKAAFFLGWGFTPHTVACTDGCDT